MFERRREPVSVGTAWPRGRVSGAPGWVLSDPYGREVPVQTAVLDRWGDGSVRWLLVDFQAVVQPESASRYELRVVPESPLCLPETVLRVDENGRAITVDTGAAVFQLPSGGQSLFDRMEARNGSALGFARSGILAEDAAGRTYTLTVSGATVERAGPLRVVVRLDGVLRAADPGSRLDIVARLHFFAGLGSVRVELSVTNPRRARHRDGYWDLGDPGSVYLRDLSVVFTRAQTNGTIACSAELMRPLAQVDGPLEIYQDSSGGENWRSSNHCNRHGNVAAVFRGYRIVSGAGEHRGLRATPVVSLGGGSSRLAVGVPHFWQNCPKALEVHEGGVTLRLFPRQYGDSHELQGGERKTHDFFVCVGDDTVSEMPLAWCRSPVTVAPSASSYAAAGVWRPLTAGNEDARSGYEALVNAAVEGPDAFAQKREIIDEYGWRHFGEIYADHEAVRQPGLISHYNNQYDAIAGCATRFCQTGDRRWWTAMDELATHVTDIDIYHCDRDKAAYNHGLFWHTSHYLPVYTATHRSHSRQMGIPGGGPGAEHNYTTGLMLHYFLTGSERSREALLDLAGWVLDMDDGAKSRFWWIDSGETGLASATFASDYSPGRGAGNSVNALLDAHRLTNDLRHLAKADQIIARCAHPSDDPHSLRLTDSERRWSYTVFLQNLGKYLEHREDRGLIDSRYDYARAVLLRYADWMADHEEPYLDHPERLEFPTETWAAQDIRKAAVFEFAARHETSETGRQLFRRRADDFTNYAISKLQTMPTRSLTRPIVLLLAHLFQRPQQFMIGNIEVAFRTPPTFGAATPFVPYKRRVLFKLALLAGSVITAALTFAWLMWFRG